tara:strand:+ start:304 stop:918 length:615 start_codon:yes stop_codon:yes gene_type:complete
MENLLKASSVLYDKEICDTMNKLKLDEKIIIENKYPELLFKNTDEFYKKRQESLEILKKGIEININKFIETFIEADRYRLGFKHLSEPGMNDFFYDCFYNCLFNMFDNKIYCEYQTHKILCELDNVFNIFYSNNCFNITKKSKKKSIELVYELMESYLIYPDGSDEEGLFSAYNICFIICDKCNKKTNYSNIDDKNVCYECEPL